MSFPLSPAEADDDKQNLLRLDRDPSPSKSPGIKVSSPNGPHQSYLDVPLNAAFRPSIDTTFSDVSVLSENQRSGRLARQTTTVRLPSRSPASPSTWRKSMRNCWIRNKGVALVLLAQFFGALMNVSTRILETAGAHGDGMHPFQILFARMSITALASCFYMWYASIPDAPLGDRSVRLLLICRGLGGFFGVFGLYYSLLYIPLSEATVLTFLAPIITCYVLSFLIPDEPFTRQQQIAGVISLFGVILIANPAVILKSITGTTASVDESLPAAGTDSSGVFPANTTSTSPFDTNPLTPTASQHLLAIGVSLLGVLGSCAAYTTIRMIGSRAHPLISVNYFAIWCTLVSIFAIAFVPSVDFRLPQNLTEWALLFFLGSCGFVMQFLLTAGLAYDSSSANGQRHEDLQGSSDSTTKDEDTDSGGGARATSMVYTQMLFALTFDKLIWGVTPGWASWAGSGLILASAVWVAVVQDQGRTNKKHGHMDSEISRRKLRGRDSDIEEGRGLMQPEEEEGTFVVRDDLGESSNSPRGEAVEMSTMSPTIVHDHVDES